MFMDSGRIVGHPELTRVRGPGGRSTSALPVIHPQSLAQLPTRRLPGTNPANFLEARFWIVSGLPTIRERSNGEFRVGNRVYRLFARSRCGEMLDSAPDPVALAIGFNRVDRVVVSCSRPEAVYAHAENRRCVTRVQPDRRFCRLAQASWIRTVVHDSVMHRGATGIVRCPPDNG